MSATGEWTPAIGGCGGAFFQVTAGGELAVELEQRNLRDKPIELRAILFGPDRCVLDEQTLLDAGAGPPQRVTLRAAVARPGVFGLMLTACNDRYGERIVWRLRTNCPNFLIETSRGHRDGIDEEPIVLAEPGRSADVCFLPRAGAFAVEVTDLPGGSAAPALFDPAGRPVATLAADGHAVAASADAGDPAAGPWRLHLPAAEGRVQIDGVTRWTPGDPHHGLALWTPDASSWFPLHAHRWLITPYHRTVHGQAGDKATERFRVHNNGPRPASVELTVEFPDGDWPVRPARQRVELAPGESAEVPVELTVPAGGGRARLRASAGDYTTFATLSAVAGEAPADRPLAMPVNLRPFGHENRQFGYRPNYPAENQVYFDADNRPFVRTAAGVASLRDGRWRTAPWPVPVDPAGKGNGTKIAFDADGDVYVLGQRGGEPMLLHSRDAGQTFAAHPLPGGEGVSFDIEQFSGHNVPAGPPPIARYTRKQVDPNLRWRQFGPMELLLGRKTDAGIAWDEPLPLSVQSLGMAAHSGIPSSLVSHGGRVHVAWGEATEPDADAPGVPAYVATIDRARGAVGDRVFIGHGAPPNDVHNTPCITMDSKGYLHVLTGTHGAPFSYARSLEPNTADAGWTDPTPVGEGLRQTYIGLVCGPDDTLHLAFRLWREGEEPSPLGHHATLACMRKPAGGEWSPPRVLVRAPLPDYSVWYHRLTIDRAGRLYLSHDYFSTYRFYRTDRPAGRRALLCSPDGGETWRMASFD